MSRLWESVSSVSIEKVPFSKDGEDEDEVDMEGASDSSDVVDAGKLCKKWESYPIGHKLER